MTRRIPQRTYRVYWRYIGDPRYSHEDVRATTALRAIYKLKKALGNPSYNDIDIYEVLVVG